MHFEKVIYLILFKNLTLNETESVFDLWCREEQNSSLMADKVVSALQISN
jgi:hypothetical protein